jgi:hypothetical protein
MKTYHPDRRQFLKNLGIVGAGLVTGSYGCGKNSVGIEVGNQFPKYDHRQLMHFKETNMQAFAQALIDNAQCLGYEIHPELKDVIKRGNGLRLNKPVTLEDISKSAKTIVTDFSTKQPLQAKTSYFNVRDIGNGIVRYNVSAQADGYLTRETVGYADKGSPINLDLELIPDHEKLVALMNDCARKTYENGGIDGSLRWNEKPKIYISTNTEFLKNGKLTDELLNHTQKVMEEKLPLWSNGFAKNLEIEIGGSVPVKPGPHYEFQDGYIIISFDNTIPGVGQAAVWDDTKDRWIEKNVISLRNDKPDANFTGTILQEMATALGAYNFPRNSIIKPEDTMLHQETLLQDFTPLDLQMGQWLYSRPAGNYAPDIDEGFPLNINDVPLTGDFDKDYLVGFPDFLILAQTFGKREGQAGYDARADLTLDGLVGFDDFLLFVQNFGRKRNPDALILTN